MGKMTLTALIIFVVDQISKYWVVQAMDLKTVGAIDVLPPFLNFRMAWNQGINWILLFLPGLECSFGLAIAIPKRDLEKGPSSGVTSLLRWARMRAEVGF